MDQQKKTYFWFPRLPSVTIATKLLRSTRDFLKLMFHMFLYNISVNSKSDHPPPGDPGDSHVLTAPGVGFSSNFLGPGLGVSN